LANPKIKNRGNYSPSGRFWCGNKGYFVPQMITKERRKGYDGNLETDLDRRVDRWHCRLCLYFVEGYDSGICRNSKPAQGDDEDSP
jgi:hypothetical protein